MTLTHASRKEISPRAVVSLFLKKSTYWLSLILIGSFMAACSSEGQKSENDDPRSDGQTQLELVEVFRIGDETSVDTVVIGYVIDLDVNAAGQVFLGDLQDQSVRVFSDEGALIRAVGSKGQGPGEFSRVSSVYIGQGDSLFRL